jgi:hypothetical protein
VGLFCKLVAIVLVVIWPAFTSHTLLTHGGIIHVVHSDDHREKRDDAAHQHLSHAQHHDHDHDEDSHEHNGDNHAFADGDYRSTSVTKLVFKPSLSALFTAGATTAVAFQVCEHLVDSPGPAPPGSTPQILQQTWQFSNRTAIPGRTPSFLS